MIYFDNSATTKPLPEIAELIYEQLSGEETFGNPGSLHRLGLKADQLFQSALLDTAQSLSCGSDELIFTSCGSESVNTAIFGYFRANPRVGKHIISTRTEHRATLAVLENLSDHGYEVEYLPVGLSGRPDPEAVEKAIRTDTGMITLTHVNNETGAVSDMAAIAAIRNRMNRNTVIHTDCVQSLGKLSIRLDTKWTDMASFSGHKIHAVKGVGLLYVRKGLRIDPLILGGGQQRGLRSGTPSPYLAMAFARALRIAQEERAEAMNRVASLKSMMLLELQKRGVVCLSPEDALPYVVSLSFPSFQSETVLHALAAEEIFVSTVSACSSKQKKISYVLSEMGVDKKLAQNAIRVSFSRFSTEEEISEFCGAVDRIYAKFSLNRG